MAAIKQPSSSNSASFALHAVRKYKTALAVLLATAFLAAGCSDDKPLAPVGTSPASSNAETPDAPAATEDTSEPTAMDPAPTAPAEQQPADTPPVTGETETPSNEVDHADVPATEIAAEIDLPSPAGIGGPEEGTFLDLNRFPYDSIVSGGPPKDGIPALTNPVFIGPSFVEYLRSDDLILGVVINGEARAYPHNIGWWHEIVNDKIGNQAISVTFCPLTGTGLVFNATDEGGRQFQLGVSGLLFNTNLIMYDRRDGTTLYPQMAFKAVKGEREGETLELLPVVETTWATWKKLYPRTRVIEKGLYGIDAYTNYPYGDYRIDHQYFLFDLVIPLRINGNPYVSDFLAKERVLGVRLDGAPKAYPFSAMGERAVINDQVGGVDLAVVWDRASNLAIPYAREVDGRSLHFELVESEEFPFIGLRDQETATLWDVRGLAVEGELAGQQLRQIQAHNSMWFAWVTFWQNTDVWIGPTQ